MNRTTNPLTLWCDAMCLWARIAQANSEAVLEFWRAIGVVPPGPVDSDVAAVVEAAARPAPAPAASAPRGRARATKNTPATAA